MQLLISWPSFPAALLRPAAAGAYTQIGWGAFIAMAHSEGGLVVNGTTMRAGPGSALLAGAFFCRESADGSAQDLPKARVGDALVVQLRDGVTVAYGVCIAGPGADPTAPGTLRTDEVLCELHQDLGLPQLLQ